MGGRNHRRIAARLRARHLEVYGHRHTAVTAQEFGRDSQTVRAPVTIQCPPPENDRPPPSEPPPPTGGLCIENPSFEGTAQLTEFGGFDATPWVICDVPGSPDIRNASIGLPGPGEEATDGATYLEMFYASPVWRETLGGSLCEPVIAGKTYSFQIDLSYQGFLTPDQAYTHVKLKPAAIGAGIFVDHIVPVTACP